MAMKFKYVHVPRADGSLHHAPYIPIFARNAQGKLLKIIALIDSGADTTLIPSDLAQILGLTAKDTPLETGGIGGSVPVKATQLSFVIQENRERYPLSIPAFILQDTQADVPLLLGRHGFFEQFHITFKQDEEKIMLKKIQPRIGY